MLRDQIKKDLVRALKSLKVGGLEVEVSRTSDLKNGDYTSSVSLKIAGKFGQSPMEIAKKITDSIGLQPYIEKLEVKEPGFINFFIKKSFWQDQVNEVLKLDKKFGSNDLARGKRARVEFVSANPTGPLHFGNARGGPIGDSIARVLEFSGYSVLREYIDNDRGNQVWELGKTLAARAGQISVKDEELAYKGEYTIELAKIVRRKLAESESKKELKSDSRSDDEIVKAFGEAGVKVQFEEIIADCRAMGIDFDLIVHESDLQAKAKDEIEKLAKKGFIKKKEGALWFAPRNEFLQDTGAVVVKSDGEYTYFTADVVYHTQKFESNYDLVVDVFGSNTIGHVPKLRALASVLGFNLENFKVILYQFVRIKRGNDIVSMSKRAGNFVTVGEVLEEVGRDALRFFMLMHDANTHMDFDLDLAREESNKNPVYYVQYAHARICSILAKSESDKELKSKSDKADYRLLTTDYELALIKQITRLPELVEDVSQSFAVHQLTTYSTSLADSFHKFYENCRVLPAGRQVISADKELSAARLELVKATRISLANTLHLLGVSAPDKM